MATHPEPIGIVRSAGAVHSAAAPASASRPRRIYAACGLARARGGAGRAGDCSSSRVGCARMAGIDGIGSDAGTGARISRCQITRFCADTVDRGRSSGTRGLGANPWPSRPRCDAATGRPVHRQIRTPRSASRRYARLRRPEPGYGTLREFNPTIARRAPRRRQRSSVNRRKRPTIAVPTDWYGAIRCQ